MRRVDIIRNGFHIGIGAWNIRDEKDSIQVLDHHIDHVLIRIYRPLNQTKTDDAQLKTILFFHGGGFSVGSAGILHHFLLN